MKKRFIAAILTALVLSGCAQTTEEVPNTTGSMAASTNISTPVIQTVQTESTPDPIALLVDSMTVEELVGQLFLARFPGKAQAAQDAASYHLGGYILFGRDFESETPQTIAALTQALQAGVQIPLLLAVDEEGGTVTRASSFPQFRESRFPSARKLYNQGGLDLVLEIEQEKCKLLSSLGLNVNMAPICDVTTDPHAFMYSRSLGQTPEITGQYIAAVVDTMGSNSIGSVLKHFPGYGNNTDTHIGTAVDTRPLASLVEADLVPFQAGISTGCDAILVSHTIAACLDNSTPASLSPAVIGYLRDTMGFNGVIVTDDLAMDAITDKYGAGESAVLAVQAGNDLLCSSDYAAQYTAVLDAVKCGKISIEQVKASTARIIRWKSNLGLIVFAD